MKQHVLIGQTDFTVLVMMRDNAGAPATALAHTDIDIAYARVETDNDVTTTDVAPADLASLTAAHSDWGWEVVSATDHPGVYRLDIADAVFASGAWSAVVTVSGTGLDPAHLEFELVSLDLKAATAPAGWIANASFANDAITASKLHSDVTTELQSGLATAAALDAVDNFVDTEISSIITTLGTPAGASISADIAAIEAQTDDIGVAGAGLTAVPWNAAWDAEVESEATDALNAYDPPTRAEATTDKNEILGYLNGLVIAKGTIGATGNDTTHLHLTGLTYGDDEINNYLIAIKDVSASEWHARYIEDWADAGDLVTVATLPFTPENSVDLYAILAFRQDVTGGSGLDAAGVRAAVGLASANLDTQLSNIDNFIDTEVATIITDVAAVKADTAAILTDTGTTLDGKIDTIDTVVDAIKAKTDSLTFTVAGNVDANIQKINDVTITGDGQSGTEFGV